MEIAAKFFDFNCSYKKLPGSLGLEILHVYEELWEHKCCDLEMVSSEVPLGKGCLGSFEQKNFLKLICDGKVKLHMTIVQRHGECGKIVGYFDYLILICEYAKDAESSHVLENTGIDLLLKARQSLTARKDTLVKGLECGLKMDTALATIAASQKWQFLCDCFSRFSYVPMDCMCSKIYDILSNGYGEKGEVGAICELFDEMYEKDIFIWNAQIASFSGMGDKCWLEGKRERAFGMPQHIIEEVNKSMQQFLSVKLHNLVRVVIDKEIKPNGCKGEGSDFPQIRFLEIIPSILQVSRSCSVFGKKGKAEFAIENGGMIDVGHPVPVDGFLLVLGLPELVDKSSLIGKKLTVKVNLNGVTSIVVVIIKGRHKWVCSNELMCFDKAIVVSEAIIKMGDFYDPWRLCTVTQLKELKGVRIKIYFKAIKEIFTSEEVHDIFNMAKEKFQEMAALALFYWGKVHMSRRKRVYLGEGAPKEQITAQIKTSCDLATTEYMKAREGYEEALKIKANFYKGFLTLDQQQFELAKLSWHYAISSNVDLETWLSIKGLQLYENTMGNMEKEMQLWEELEEQFISELSKSKNAKIQPQKMGAGFLAMSAAEEIVGLEKETVGLEMSYVCQCWEAMIGKALDEPTTFERRGSKQLAGLLISFWVRKNHKPCVGKIFMTTIPCGLGCAIGNKGEVCLRIRVNSRITDCHVASLLEVVNRSKADFDSMYQNVVFGQLTHPPKTAAALSTLSICSE